MTRLVLQEGHAAQSMFHDEAMQCTFVHEHVRVRCAITLAHGCSGNKSQLFSKLRGPFKTSTCTHL
jgi:hypothetical protein